MWARGWIEPDGARHALAGLQEDLIRLPLELGDRPYSPSVRYDLVGYLTDGIFHVEKMSPSKDQEAIPWTSDHLSPLPKDEFLALMKDLGSHPALGDQVIQIEGGWHDDLRQPQGERMLLLVLMPEALAVVKGHEEFVELVGIAAFDERYLLL